jgi:hypothetical protein
MRFPALLAALLAATALGSDPATPAVALPSSDQEHLEASIGRLGELTGRPDLSSSGYLAEVRAKVPLLDDPQVPAILRECLDHPFRAPEQADRIAAAMLGETLLEARMAYAASLLHRKDAGGGGEVKLGENDLKTLPEPLQGPLRKFLYEAACARADALAASADLSPGEMREAAGALIGVAAGPLAGEMGFPKPMQAPPTKALERFQPGRMAAAAIRLGAAACKLAGVPRDALPPEARLEMETSLGTIVIGGSGPTHHPAPSKPVLLALDLGGNDAWEGGYAAADGGAGAPLACLVDLGGDDLYLAGKPWALGAGLFGAGILLDLGGDDRYVASHLSLGCGVFGWGVLHDAGGNDSYRGATHTQGAALGGFGLLLDDQGQDRYQADLDAQGFAFVLAVGILADGGGDDHYLAGGKYQDDLDEAEEASGRTKSRSQGFGWGWRAGLPGGIGCLLDRSGNDVYDTGQGGMAQGLGYWLSFGLLWDGDGDDVYDANYYSQGVGLHLGTGLLVDLGGNDAYKLTGGGGQGWGHDYATAFLVDRSGNDRYAISRTPLSRGFQIGYGQGGGNIRGIGVLLDGAGDDRYNAGPEWTKEDKMKLSQMQATKKKHPEMTDEEILARRRGIGIRLDLGGSDTYAPSGKDGTRWLRMLSCLSEDRE